MSRQNYYKARKQRKRQAIDESLVLSLVRQERCGQPQLGGRKLLHLLAPELESADVRLGRDRFFELLSEHDLLIERRVRRCRTTDSRHGFATYENLLKSLELTGPHQAWVSDITYLRTETGFVYLALVMDAYSRAIVGFDCSDSLEALGACRALCMAMKQLPCGSCLVHHSDRGTQYCCHAYTQLLRTSEISISMTEENHCYENSQAERLNGILKQEYGLSDVFADVSEARRAVREAVALYNYRRPHQSLEYACPMTVHQAA